MKPQKWGWYLWTCPKLFCIIEFLWVAGRNFYKLHIMISEASQKNPLLTQLWPKIKQDYERDKKVCHIFKVLIFKILAHFWKKWHTSGLLFQITQKFHACKEFTYWNNASNLIWHFKWLFMGYIDIGYNNARNRKLSFEEI